MIAELLNISSYFDQGGWVMYLLGGLSMLLWYTLGYRFTLLRKRNSLSLPLLLAKARQGQLESNSILEDAVNRMSRISQESPFVDLNLRAVELNILTMLNRHRTLAQVATGIAPLLGLLGTVIGMIDTFDSLADMTLFAASGGGIADGVAKALFTTQMGLVVAVPGLIIGRMLNRRQQNLASELEAIKLYLSNPQP